MKHQFTNHVFSRLRYIFLICVFLLSATSGYSNHFRFGTVTWQRVPGNPYQIKFKVSMAFRRLHFSDGATLHVGSIKNIGSFRPGVGTTTMPVNLFITAVNYTDDWFYGEWTSVYTYPSVAASYQANFQSLSYRIGAPLINNTLGPVYFSAKVQVGAENNNNDGPVSTIQPIINCRVDDADFQYQIPAIDPNGDALTYSLTPADSFGAGSVHPAGMSITSSGKLKWNTVGKTIGDLYNTSIRITDAKGAWTTLDVLLRIVGNSTPSDFDYSVSPQNGTIFDIQPGDSIAFQVKASDIDAGDTVKMLAIGLPPGATFTTIGTNPVIGVFGWKPGADQEGDYVVNVISEDDAGVQNNTVVFFNVSYKPKFNVPTTPGNNSVFTLKPGDTITHEVAAYHPDSNNKLELVALSGVKAGMVYTPNFPLAKAKFVGTTFKWIPAATNWGINKLVYKATDTIHFESAYDTMYYFVDNPPVITSAPDTIAKAGVPYTYVLNAYDVDSIYGDKIKLEVAQLPSWLTATPNGNNSWLITGTPTIANLGNVIISLEVADSLNHILGTHAGNIVQLYTLKVVPPAGGLQFDGVNDYVRVTAPYASFGKEITVDFYASIDPTSKIGSGISQSTENIDGAQHMMWMMHYSGSGVMQFYVSDNGAWKHADAAVTPGVHRYTGVAGPAGIKIYVDGVLAATSPDVVNNGILNVANSVMHFGKDSRYATGRFMKGQIDEVRIWNRALCASELQQYNSCQLGGPQNGLVEYYTFNQGHVGANNSTINTLTDASGNNKNGTLQNFALTGNTSNWVSGSINNACSAYVPPVASITAGGSTTVCYGESVVLTANAGSSYQWTKNGADIPNATSQVYTATQSGAYAVKVFAAGGCAGVSPVANVTVAPQLTVAGNAVNALIFGTNTGSINITATGGTAPYNYAWSNNATTEDINGIGMGNYSVVVSDAINCTASNAFTVSQPAQLLATASVSNALIYNTNTGGINLTVAGGVGPYSFSWSNNASTEDITTVGAGTYTVTVTDANGAMFTATYTITQPDPLTVTGVVANATIYNLANGAINITPAGGVGPYTYGWTNNATTEDIASIGAGIYSVTITDANGATATGTYTVTQPDQLLAIASVSNAIIYNTNTGGINLTVTGGVGPYTYSWSNNATSEDLSAIGAGTYTVTVTDANGATFTATYTITQPAQLTVAGVVANATIYNVANGTVNITVTGGVGPYTFSWSNSATSEDISGVSAGTYAVTVTDANGATAMGSYTVGQPAQLLATASVSNVLIYNASTGAINLTVTGGVGPYSYLWNGNVTTEDRTNVPAGSYTVTVTDANGATFTATYTVTQPAQLLLTGAVTNATIYGVSNGAINITATGGVGPYSYLWNGNITTEDRTNIPAGTYTVTVTDANGATRTGVFTITQPTQLNGAISVNPVYSVNSNHVPYTLYKGYRDYTYLTAVPTGGMPGYTYSWSPATGCSNPTSATTKVTPAVTTTYTVTITDSKGAIKTVSQTINVIDVRCYAGNSPLHKIYVCHNGKNTICIDTNALATHLNQHGDLVGRCEDYQNKNSYDEGGHEDGLTAIGEIAKNMVLFPNPSDGRFAVKLPALGQEGQLVVRDITGKIVSMSTVTSSDVEQILQIDLSNVAKGTYIIMVSSGDEMYKSSMLVQ
ncbi:LamG-like jellyroll fold domain-containing protein [Polluticoccus soli]|uniref:LamG-like jellyroll fold domain-containing protein n=1 Tax=Polluticoccus soli TaxID=3034150 RepID=UPI0023E0ED7D|nr:LamG-like jellyroll fold domain-containing protein [Flavipsychrobacter sp. JY13-12]